VRAQPIVQAARGSTRIFAAVADEDARHAAMVSPAC
jgi:hypothetical protein